MTEYFPRHYRSLGKEVLLDGEHAADARSPELAALIAESLNQRPANLGAAAGVLHDEPLLEMTEPRKIEGLKTLDDWLLSEGIADEVNERANERIEAMRHAVRQEGDEYACSCGKRWDVADGEEHP